MKKFALVLMSVLMAVLLIVPAMAAGDEGMTFNADTLSLLSKDLEKAPLTIEVVIRLPKGYDERAGLIISNYAGNAKDAIALQFNSSKNLELYYQLEDATSLRHAFSEVPVSSLATGEWVHIAVVKDDAAGQVHCYINGEFVQTSDVAAKPYGYFTDGVDPMPFCIGGDHRNGNTQYFKGEIREIALFSDIRTADEIKSDAAAIKADSNMQVWLQLSKGDTAAKDLSGNGNHMGDYVEPETSAVTAAPSNPAAPATFDAGILFAVIAASTAGVAVVSKKRR